MTNMNAERNTRMLAQHSPLAVEFAAHLERGYGLQLDDMRHKALIVEIEAHDAGVIAWQREEFAKRWTPTVLANRVVLNDAYETTIEEARAAVERVHEIEGASRFAEGMKELEWRRGAGPSAEFLDAASRVGDALQAARDASLGHPEPTITNIQVPGAPDA